MNSRFLRILALLLTVVLLFGCAGKPDSGEVNSKIWKSWPALTFGQMESDKLSVVAWDSGRTESTSGYRFAETKNGFYRSWNGWLWYADKQDLTNWMVVCDAPDCDHTDRMRCKGRASANWMIESGGRIYFQENGSNPYKPQDLALGSYVVSVAADGSDKQYVYVNEDTFTSLETMSTGYFLDGAWVYSHTELDKNGNLVYQLYRVTEEETQVFKKSNKTDAENIPSGAVCMPASFLTGMRGEPYLYWSVWSENKLLQFQDGELIECIDIDLLPDKGYASGNIIRGFESGDGYYDINMETGERVRLADAMLENSNAFIYLPNCIVESTLFPTPTGTTGYGAMEMFDGKSWRTVKLPEKWLNPGSQMFLSVLAITSDSILLEGSTQALTAFTTDLYRIALDEEELKLEFVTTLEIPMTKEQRKEYEIRKQTIEAQEAMNAS